MIDSGAWTAIGTGALAVGTFALAWVTVRTGTKDRETTTRSAPRTGPAMIAFVRKRWSS